MLLKNFKVGDKVFIVDNEFNCNNPLCQKLFALGFLPGEPVNIIRTSKFNNMMLIKKNNTSVFIRTSDADIEVQ